METIRPRNQYVLVKRDRLEELTKGGIALPQQTLDEVNRKNPRGTVLAVGPGRVIPEWFDRAGSVEGARVSIASRCPITYESEEGERIVRPKDRVILRAYSLQAYTVVDAKQDIVLVDESDILAVIEDEHELAGMDDRDLATEMP